MFDTAHALGKLITEEVDAGIDASRIMLGGFSQGGTWYHSTHSTSVADSPVIKVL